MITEEILLHLDISLKDFLKRLEKDYKDMDPWNCYLRWLRSQPGYQEWNTLEKFYRDIIGEDYIFRVKNQLKLNNKTKIVKTICYRDKPPPTFDEAFFIRNIKERLTLLDPSKVPAYRANNIFLSKVSDAFDFFASETIFSLYSHIFENEDKYKKVIGNLFNIEITDTVIDYIFSLSKERLDKINTTVVGLIRKIHPYWMYANWDHPFFRMTKRTFIFQEILDMQKNDQKKIFDEIYKRRQNVISKYMKDKKLSSLDNKDKWVAFFEECIKKHSYLSIASERLLKYDITEQDQLKRACRDIYINISGEEVSVFADIKTDRNWSRSFLIYACGGELPPELEALIENEIIDCQGDLEGLFSTYIENPVTEFDDYYNNIVEQCACLEDKPASLAAYQMMIVDAIGDDRWDMYDEMFRHILSALDWWKSVSAVDYLDHHEQDFAYLRKKIPQSKVQQFETELAQTRETIRNSVKKKEDVNTHRLKYNTAEFTRWVEKTFIF